MPPSLGLGVMIHVSLDILRVTFPTGHSVEGSWETFTDLGQKGVPWSICLESSGLSKIKLLYCGTSLTLSCASVHCES